MPEPRSRESAILNRVLRKVSVPSGSPIVLGIGDDCAIFRPRRLPEDLLFTTDMLLEDVHFRRTTHGPRDIGYKALARGLSDIAAMGGEPRFCLLSLAVPRWADQDWVDRFYRGFLRWRRKHRHAARGRRSGPCGKIRLRCDRLRGCPARQGASAIGSEAGRRNLCLRQIGRLRIRARDRRR